MQTIANNSNNIARIDSDAGALRACWTWIHCLNCQCRLCVGHSVLDCSADSDCWAVGLSVVWYAGPWWPVWMDRCLSGTVEHGYCRVPWIGKLTEPHRKIWIEQWIEKKKIVLRSWNNLNSNLIYMKIRLETPGGMGVIVPWITEFREWNNWIWTTDCADLSSKVAKFAVETGPMNFSKSGLDYFDNSMVE